MRGFPLTERKRKKRPLLEDESTCWGRYFYVSCWRWDSHFPWSSELHEGLAFSRIKAVPSCVAFKPLCKKEHPRIVTFSSLHNAYFDKLCHAHDCLRCSVFKMSCNALISGMFEDPASIAPAREIEPATSYQQPLCSQALYRLS